MRLAVWLLAIEFIGILSPLILLPGREFAGPHHAPTLEGQYCLKDIILVTAALVIAAGSFRGGKLVRSDLPPNITVGTVVPPSAEHKLRVVLDGIGDRDAIAAACAKHDVTESDFQLWRGEAVTAALLALRPTTEPGSEAVVGAVASQAACTPATRVAPSGATIGIGRFLAAVITVRALFVRS